MIFTTDGFDLEEQAAPSTPRPARGANWRALDRGLRAPPLDDSIREELGAAADRRRRRAARQTHDPLSAHDGSARGDDALTIDDARRRRAARHAGSSCRTEPAPASQPPSGGPTMRRADRARVRVDDGRRRAQARARRGRRAARLQQPDAPLAPDGHRRGRTQAAVLARRCSPARRVRARLVGCGLRSRRAPRGRAECRLRTARAHDRLARPVRSGSLADLAAGRWASTVYDPRAAPPRPRAVDPAPLAKEGLAFINSNAFTLGWTALALDRISRLLDCFDEAAALTFEGMLGNVQASRQRRLRAAP